MSDDIYNEAEDNAIYEKYANLPGLSGDFSDWLGRMMIFANWQKKRCGARSDRAQWAWERSSSMFLSNPVMIELADFIERMVDTHDKGDNQ